MKLNRKNKKGFTIVELVIVIAVIGILSAILIPTFANLTTEAQKAAKKQQVSDAYTAYLVEATDGDFDQKVYQLRTAAETPTDSDYKERAASIQHKAQAEVALKLGENEWYEYSSEKGWVTYTPTSAPTVLVVALAANADDYSGSYVKLAANSYEATTAAKLSTFNGVVVYVK